MKMATLINGLLSKKKKDRLSKSSLSINNSTNKINVIPFENPDGYGAWQWKWEDCDVNSVDLSYDLYYFNLSDSE